MISDTTRITKNRRVWFKIGTILIPAFALTLTQVLYFESSGGAMGVLVLDFEQRVGGEVPTINTNIAGEENFPVVSRRVGALTKNSSSTRDHEQQQEDKRAPAPGTPISTNDGTTTTANVVNKAQKEEQQQQQWGEEANAAARGVGSNNPTALKHDVIKTSDFTKNITTPLVLIDDSHHETNAPLPGGINSSSSGTSKHISCRRRCRFRKNIIVLDGFTFGFAGLNDRFTIFDFFANWAGYLCATAYASPPHMMLTPNHNGYRNVSANLSWSDFKVSTFLDGNATALVEHFFGPDENLLPPKEIESGNNSWLNLNLTELEGENDLISQLKRLFDFVDSQQQEESVQEAFLWKIHRLPWEELDGTPSDIERSSTRFAAARPSSFLPRPFGACRYVKDGYGETTRRLVDQIFDSIRQAHPTKPGFVHFHIRRGDAEYACDTNLRRMHYYMMCSLHGEMTSTISSMFGNMTMLLASDEWDPCYRRAIQHMVERGLNYGFVDLDATIRMVLNSHIARNGVDARLDNNYYLFHLGNLVARDPRINLRLEQRRHHSCNDCETTLGSNIVNRNPAQGFQYDRAVSRQLKRTLKDYRKCTKGGKKESRFDEHSRTFRERFVEPVPMVSIEHELRKQMKSKNASLERGQELAFMTTHVDRIYYINMDHRSAKRAIMESWLSKQPIPYQRIPGQRGENDTCVPWKLGAPCIGLTGLANTNVYIMDNMNTTGLTLVLEDDFVIKDMTKLLASVHLVPPDWDVLRWDCFDLQPPHLQQHPFSFETTNTPECQQNETRGIVRQKDCEYWGGTHAVMWKGGKSLEKLRRVWSSHPHDDIDGQLMDRSIKSYCIQVGVGEVHSPPKLLWDTDIPKVK